MISLPAGIGRGGARRAGAGITGPHSIDESPSSPDSSDGDDGDSSIEWGPVIPAPARRAPPRPIPEGKEIIEIE